MSNPLTFLSMRYAVRLFLAALLFSTAAVARAGDLKLEARLVWGTNEEKADPNCKPVDAGLSEKLHGTFKWKNYYEITNQLAAIPVGQSRDIKMSDKCMLRVKNLGDSRIEVSCIGDGKEVHKGAYSLTPPKWLVLGGNDKDNTAWFVGVRASDETKAISKN